MNGRGEEEEMKGVSKKQITQVPIDHVKEFGLHFKFSGNVLEGFKFQKIVSCG